MEEIKHNTLYDTKQVGKLLGLSVFTIQRYIRDGKLRAKKVGRSYKILGEWISDYFKSLPDAW
jgi:excisionase family DNA binding protein